MRAPIVRRITLIILAVALVSTNIDYVVAPLVVSTSGAGWKVFLILAVLGNLEAMAWFLLGKELVPILRDIYGWVLEKQGNSFRAYPILMALRPFYEWDKTKQDFDRWRTRFFQSPTTLALTCLAGIFLPGVRTPAAIVFGVDRWKKGLAALMVINAFHIAYSVGFWNGLTHLIRSVGLFLH
ncbi:MAG TPA: hypothetical protein VG941_02030 [Candidatus Paceibacterota bacterium]|nr:hypothetical protein [Candidatus Paceibacterota bacterium]